MPNHLANETSPYLLQHKNNPVDWHPWGPEALALAKKLNKPIFLSIGYSACHWCHVMEHESFEDERIAKIINEHFIPIKVDREERPDIDQIYMNAVQMMTGRGGWPMSVFLTPELKPFFAGTYYPPKRHGQMPGFDEVLNAVNTAWTERREQVEQGADQITEQLKRIDQASAGALNQQLITAAVAQLKQAFDSDWGGFGAAPKFPHTMEIQLLLRSWHRTGDPQTLDIVKTTLDRMAAGGIYDHLGGGFARYSVDERWLAPHFEKMLYDNALLVRCYMEAALATDDKQDVANYERVVRETLDYVLRDMTDDAGGFYSTEDADSEGEEGKFYVWTPAELQQVLGAKAAETFARVYDVSESGNFEGNNILNLPKSLSQAAKVLGRDEQELRAELAASRAKLFAARENRVHPAKDDKVIVAWNGLMIDAIAFTGAALDEPRYIAAARKAADFLLKNLRRDDGRLLHTWRHGKAKLDAYLDDYTALANGLVTLYESTFAVEYLEAAIELMQFVEKHFSDAESGAFFYTADDHEELLTRNKELTDGATPGGNSLAAYALLRLAKLTGSQQDAEAAQKALEAAAGLMERAPLAMGQMLVALDFYLGPTYELVLSGKPSNETTQAVLSDLRGRFLPNTVVALAKDDSPAKPLADLLVGKSPGETPMLYVCENFTCQAPAEGKAAIDEALDKLGTNSQEKGLLEQ